MKGTYEQLKLENQLCFPLYACSKEIVRMYRPFLDPLDLTYTQYIAMLALWERDGVSVKELGGLLKLDSGTLTPVLKKLESKGYVVRGRSAEDERNLIISLTDSGRAMREKAAQIPLQLSRCLPLTQEEAVELHSLLHKILSAIEESSEKAAG